MRALCFAVEGCSTRSHTLVPPDVVSSRHRTRIGPWRMHARSRGPRDESIPPPAPHSATVQLPIYPPSLAPPPTGSAASASASSVLGVPRRRAFGLAFPVLDRQTRDVVPRSSGNTHAPAEWTYHFSCIMVICRVPCRLVCRTTQNWQGPHAPHLAGAERGTQWRRWEPRPDMDSNGRPHASHMKLPKASGSTGPEWPFR